MIDFTIILVLKDDREHINKIQHKNDVDKEKSIAYA